MFRRALVDLLADHPMTVSEIARSLDVPPREVEEDLRHLRKTFKHSGLRMMVTPARCRKCNFTFSVDKLNKPGRCPRCHETWISEPQFQVTRH